MLVSKLVRNRAGRDLTGSEGQELWGRAEGSDLKTLIKKASQHTSQRTSQISQDFLEHIASPYRKPHRILTEKRFWLLSRAQSLQR